MVNHDDDHDDEVSHHKREASEGPTMSDAIKKLVTAGISAAFMTEESVRSFVSELKLPKETLNLLLQGAAKSKEDLMARVSREIIGMVSKIDIVKEATRFAEDHKFRINAEIEIVRKDSSAKDSSAKDPLGKSPLGKNPSSQEADQPSSAASHSESLGASEISVEVRSGSKPKV
jgi:hypothetical protein